MTDWKPGDVALIEVGCHANRRMAQRVDGDVAGWGYVTREGNVEVILDTTGIVTPLRRLAVIDPENREDVERLAAAYTDAVHARTGGAYLAWESRSPKAHVQIIDDLQLALREYANPTPPKPPEPKGLGAVVEDARGRRWVRSRPSSDWPWECTDTSHRHRFGYVDAVRVLSEGWSE